MWRLLLYTDIACLPNCLANHLSPLLFFFCCRNACQCSHDFSRCFRGSRNRSVKHLMDFQFSIFRCKKTRKFGSGIKAGRLADSEAKIWKNYEGSDRLFLQWRLGKGNRIIPDLKGNWMACKIRSSFGHCLPAAFTLQMVHRIYPSHHSAASPVCGLVKGSRNAAVSHRILQMFIDLVKFILSS